MTYTVQRRLGRGGNGVVDLALDDDGNPVALKRLALAGSADDMARARARLRREAEALAGLDHPSIVPLIEVIDDGDDLVLVMAYYPGGSLADVVRNHGPLDDGQLRALARPLLEALAVAHRHGVVHRDITPANVLFDREGRPYLADFGTAQLRDATGGLTVTGTVLGTPEFMAPEQARGEQVSSACDLFALGATLLWARTGTGPWGAGDPFVLLGRAANGTVARVDRAIAPDVRDLLTSLLARRPERRPSAAAAVGGPAGTERAATRGAPRGLVGVAAAVLMVVAGVAGTLWMRSAETDAAEQAPTAVLGEDEIAADKVPACEDLPYQRCGEPPAPNTDGVRCLGGTADYDGDTDTGCEAEPDDPDGSLLVDRLSANLVPADDVDEFSMQVEDRFQFLCDGTLYVTLTAPAGVSMRLEVLDRSGRVLGATTSSDARASTVSLTEPSCGADDSTTLTARVSWVGEERSAELYTLARRGSW